MKLTELHTCLDISSVCCLFALVSCSCLVSEFALSGYLFGTWLSILAFVLSWRKNFSLFAPSWWYLIHSGAPNVCGHCSLCFLLPCSSTQKRLIWSDLYNNSSAFWCIHDLIFRLLHRKCADIPPAWTSSRIYPSLQTSWNCTSWGRRDVLYFWAPSF